MQPVQVFEDKAVYVVPHHVLVISYEACHVGARGGVLQNRDALRAAVDHVANDVKPVVGRKVDLLQHGIIKFILAVDVTAYVCAHGFSPLSAFSVVCVFRCQHFQE